MGSKTSIVFHEEWKEPAILWTIIAATKGERKSPALKRIKDAVTRIQDNKQTKWFNDKEKQETPTRASRNPTLTPPQILIDVFSMEEMHNVLLRNNYQILGIYEEIKVLHQSLDIYKPGGSLVDRKQFLNLNGGSSWDRNFKNSGYSHLPRTHFNHSGMIQPLILADMMDKDDWDGFNDRYLISCPKEVNFTSDMYKVPVPEEMRNAIDKMFIVLDQKHDNGITYTFSEEARVVFNAYHDNYYIEKKRQFGEDDNRRGVLSKSLGYIVRLAGMISAIDNATNVVRDNLDIDNYEWTTVVTATATNKAITLMKYFLDTKFALLPPCEVISETCPNLSTQSQADPQSQLVNNSGPKIKRLLEYSNQDSYITTSVACRNALIPAVPKDQRGDNNNRFPAWAAEKFFKDVTSLGFGSVETKIHSINKSASVCFRKRKYQELSENARDILKKIKVDADKYVSGSKELPDAENKENQG